MSDAAPVIRTPDHRVRVFVSSTLQELAGERAAARASIERMRLSPILFELGARPHPPRELYRAYLEQSDVFLGIYWQRYGWIAPGMAISGLEDEYLLCGDRPRLIYVKSPAPAREAGLDGLLRRIRADDRAAYKPFATTAELGDLVENDLAVLLTERFDAGRRPGAAEPGGGGPINNLPVQRGALVGRESDAATVAGAIARDEAGVVTLTGPGGCGKTRLAVHVAATMRERFADGACFVDLSRTADVARVPALVAQSLGVPEDGVAPLVETLRNALHHRALLLVMDNFEQVVGAGTFVADLLGSCPRLKVLATSRQALRIRGEQEIPIRPLAVDGVAAEGPAVELFVRRARDVRPDFALTPDTAGPVAEICRRLDGLPLAIELAAVRVRVLGPAAILQRLGQGLSVLGGGARDLPERQQTMRAAIQWSHDLLADRERALFSRLAVFAGGFDLNAAERVAGGDDTAGDVLDGLSSLVDKNLVVAGDALGEPRFSMLSLVREFGLARLDDVPDEGARVRARHARHFLDVFADGEERVFTPARVRLFPRIDLEEGNAQAAFEFLLGPGGDVEGALRLAVAWGMGRSIHGQIREAGHGVEAALALPDAEKHAALAARARTLLGMTCIVQWRTDEARRHLGAAAEFFAASDDPTWHCRAARFLGMCLLATGDYDGALTPLRAALDSAPRATDPWAQCQTLEFLARAYGARGEFAAAEELAERAAAAARATADPVAHANVLSARGMIEVFARDWTAARRHLEECLPPYAATPTARWFPESLLGLVLLQVGELDAATEHARRALVGCRNQGTRPGVLANLLTLSGVAVARGETERARRLLAGYAGLSAGVHDLGMFALAGFASVALANLQAALGDPEPLADPESAIDLALANGTTPTGS